MALGLRDMEYFAAVAEHGNLGRAAEALGLSQPALSKSLRRLEGSVQTKLVRKVPKGIELTTVGAAFLAHIQRIRLSLNDVAHEVSDLTEGRAAHIRIGCGPEMIELFVQTICNRLLSAAPKVTLAVTAGINDVLFPSVINGELDLIISGLPATPYKELVHEHLFEDEFVVYANAKHPLAKRNRVTMEDLTRQRWILSNRYALARSKWIRTFENRGMRPPEVAAETNSHALMLRTVASSDLLGFVPRTVLRSAASSVRASELRIRDADWSRRVGISYRKNAYLSPAALRFIELAKAATKIVTETEERGRERAV